MSQTSLNAIIAIKSKNIIPNHKYLLSSIIIGIMLPDLDFIIEYIINQLSLIDYKLYNSIFHSIFIIPFIALLILIYSEYKNKEELKIVSIGISIGIGFHILLDIITMQSIGLFSPLFNSSQNFDLKEYFNINLNIISQNILYCFEFLFFRIYGWLLIQEIIKKPQNNSKLIKKINLWIKLELYIFVLLILFIYFGVNDIIFTNIYSLLYILSFLFALYITYRLRKTLN